jgi:hypothetical protein
MTAPITDGDIPGVTVEDLQFIFKRADLAAEDANLILFAKYRRPAADLSTEEIEKAYEALAPMDAKELQALVGKVKARMQAA